MNFIEKQPFDIIKSRKVLHYGYDFKYGLNNIDSNDPKPIPQIFKTLIEKISLYLKDFFKEDVTLD